MIGEGLVDIGYHFLIDNYGNIYKGRGLDFRGAHVSGTNTGNIGILLMSDYQPGMEINIGSKSVNFSWDINGDDLSPSGAQVNSLAQLISWLNSQYGIDSVVGHRDLNNTLCPGDNAYQIIPYLNNLVR